MWWQCGCSVGWRVFVVWKWWEEWIVVGQVTWGQPWGHCVVWVPRQESRPSGVVRSGDSGWEHSWIQTFSTSSHTLWSSFFFLLLIWKCSLLVGGTSLSENTSSSSPLPLYVWKTLWICLPLVPVSLWEGWCFCYTLRTSHQPAPLQI